MVLRSTVYQQRPVWEENRLLSHHNVRPTTKLNPRERENLSNHRAWNCPRVTAKRTLRSEISDVAGSANDNIYGVASFSTQVGGRKMHALASKAPKVRGCVRTLACVNLFQ